jgi:cytochrome c biogenesis protein CcmG/thiol:disulfide interchange protein DsbE
MDNVNELLTPQQSSPRRGLSLGSMVLLTGVLMVTAVFGFALSQRNQTQPESGPAPDFTLTTLDGAHLRLSDLRGRVVVINFWASWCGPCRQEAPALQSVWEQYQNRDVVIVGVAYTDTERNARAFIQEYEQTYPNGLDIGTKIYDLYNAQGVPETFIINRAGEVAEFMKVPLTEKTLTEAIERVLGSGA